MPIEILVLANVCSSLLHAGLSVLEDNRRGAVHEESTSHSIVELGVSYLHISRRRTWFEKCGHRPSPWLVKDKQIRGVAGHNEKMVRCAVFHCVTDL